MLSNNERIKNYRAVVFLMSHCVWQTLVSENNEDNYFQQQQGTTLSLSHFLPQLIFFWHDGIVCRIFTSETQLSFALKSLSYQISSRETLLHIHLCSSSSSLSLSCRVALLRLPGVNKWMQNICVDISSQYLHRNNCLRMLPLVSFTEFNPYSLTLSGIKRNLFSTPSKQQRRQICKRIRFINVQIVSLSHEMSQHNST